MLTPQPADRLYFLDWLRIAAFATLVLFHVGMYYVTWDFHVKSPFAGPGLEPWMVLTAPWRMSLLFMVSGAATAYMLRSGSTLAVARRRSRQLLLPLLFGIVFIIPPQSYFQVVQKFAYAGGYFDFFRLYLGHYHGFCSKGVCLILPTWNHLWFLPYVWVYTLLLCTTLAVFPTALQVLARAVSGALGSVSLMLVPMMLILLARLVLFERFPTTYALWGDWFSHVVYLAMFVAGAVFATPPVIWPRLQVLRWPALWLALGFWAVLVAVRPAKPIEHGVIAIFQWSALVAAFGFAVQHLNVDAPFRVRLVEAVFPVYILHQTILIVASQLLLGLHWRPVVEAPVLIVLTLCLSYFGYEAVRRVGILRPWFGMKSKPNAA
jgi:glucans biosynthesis protein C